MSDGMGREFTYPSSHATNLYFIPNWGSGFCHESHEVMIPATTDLLRGSFSAAFAGSKLRSLSWSSPQYAISDGGGEAAWHQSRLISDDCFSTAPPPHWLPHFSNGTKNGHSKWWNLL